MSGAPATTSPAAIERNDRTRTADLSIVMINKNDPEIAETLPVLLAHARASRHTFEFIVVDASAPRFESVRRRHPEVRWIAFDPEGRGVSIAAQRNTGVAESRGDIVVFVDVGCVPREGWLDALVEFIVDGTEDICAGPTLADTAGGGIYAQRTVSSVGPRYLPQAGTGNLAVRRGVFEVVGGFDHHFDYGSDVDFTWRTVERGYRIREIPTAVVEHDWGVLSRSSWRTQVRRSFLYGRASARLYGKHRNRLRRILKDDPMVVAYPVFLLGLPVALIWPWYLLLLVVAGYRNRRHRPLEVVADHLIYGAGVLRELVAR